MAQDHLKNQQKQKGKYVEKNCSPEAKHINCSEVIQRHLRCFPISYFLSVQIILSHLNGFKELSALESPIKKLLQCESNRFILMNKQPEHPFACCFHNNVPDVMIHLNFTDLGSCVNLMTQALVKFIFAYGLTKRFIKHVDNVNKIWGEQCLNYLRG